jgi:hypothetical protein
MLADRGVESGANLTTAKGVVFFAYSYSYLITKDEADIIVVDLCVDEECSLEVNATESVEADSQARITARKNVYVHMRTSLLKAGQIVRSFLIHCTLFYVNVSKIAHNSFVHNW